MFELKTSQFYGPGIIYTWILIITISIIIFIIFIIIWIFDLLLPNYDFLTWLDVD